MFFSDRIPLRARIYIGGVIAAGVPVLVLSAYRTLWNVDFGWVSLAFLTILGGFFPITIPSFKEQTQSLSLTVSDVFVFAALLLYGPLAAVTLSVLDVLVSTFRAPPNPLYKHVFNASMLALVTLAVGRLFYFMMGVDAPLKGSEVDPLIPFFVALGVTGCLFYTLNSGSIALAISLVAGQSWIKVWRVNFFWGSLATIAGASLAALIFLTFEQFHLVSVALTMPVIIVVFYAYKMNLTRINEAHDHAREVNELYHSTIASLAMAIDAKDQCTHGHVHRVQNLALELAKRVGFTKPSDLEGLRAAALLHDIGKLAIPEYILNKPSPLTEWEARKMQVHPSVGADILALVPFPYPVVPFVRHHHERWDGSGYPDNLAGDRIPMGARILAVVDCYDALRSDRPYRPKLAKDAALDYLKTQAGKAYDPSIVRVLVDHIDEFEGLIDAVGTSLPTSFMRRIEDYLSAEPEESAQNSHTVFHDIASAHKEIQAAYEISQTVGKSLSVSETLALLGAKIRKMIPCEGCSIYMLNSQTNTVVPYFATGFHSEILEEVEMRIGDGVTGWVAANNQTLFNVSPAPDFNEQPLLKAIFHGCLSIPLAIEENVLGVITLYSRQPDQYREEHLRLMETVARQAASAINNAIIYEETQEDAYTDLLTGLPNLRYFTVFGNQELLRANRVGYPVSFLMMDLEGFKTVNDRFGHRAGDRVLIEIAHILRNQMRKSDTCIRYGGDEFVGILPGVHQQLVQPTLDRIQEAVDGHQIVLEQRQTLRVGISVGSATYPEDGRDLELLLEIADQAMYRDKVTRGRRRAPADILPFDRRDPG